MSRFEAPTARTYFGAASAAGPLLFVRSTARAKLGEWVHIGGPGQDARRGQIILVHAAVTSQIKCWIIRPRNRFGD